MVNLSMKVQVTSIQHGWWWMTGAIKMEVVVFWIFVANFVVIDNIEGKRIPETFKSLLKKKNTRHCAIILFRKIIYAFKI